MITQQGKKNKEKDFSIAHKDLTERTKASSSTRVYIAKTMDISANIIDVLHTPDVAAWNKEIQVNGDVEGITANRLHGAEILPPTTISIGLKDKKASRKI